MESKRAFSRPSEAVRHIRDDLHLQKNHDISEAYSDFLSGRKLSVGRRFRDVSVRSIVDRIGYLRHRCAGKKVLHIGCLDHPEIILEKIQNGTWLHGIISDVSEVCLGIDINPSGYEMVRMKLDCGNIRLLDLSKPLGGKDISWLHDFQWDLILCPEILEHITNHQQFLQNLHDLSHCGTTLIVTGPNAFRFANFVNTWRGFESVNSDHKYWFTFYTLSRMLAAHGWQPRRLIYYRNLKKYRLWLRTLYHLAERMSRAFSDGLIIEATRSYKSPLDETDVC